jgi:hypothetical protein
MNRRIGLMAAGGKLRDEAWFAKSDAIVANAAAIGSELATVFLGDGLILEALATLDTSADGQPVTEAEIKYGMQNIPTARVHVAAIDGATVEEIKWGIANGWLPAKTAYTIVHAGRAEVAGHPELSGATQALSESIGKKIGSIYPVLKSHTQEQAGNTTSVIFAGIIPDAASNVHSDNVSYINGNGGIKSGEFGTDIDDSYIKMMGPISIDAFKAQANARLNNQPTNVAMLKSSEVFPANKKMDYRYYMAQANQQARKTTTDHTNLTNEPHERGMEA